VAILGDSAIFANVAFTPQQMADTRRSASLSPVHRLQFAVLEDGLRCAGVIGRRTYPPRKRVTPTSTASATDRLRKAGIKRVEAIRWMFADDADGPFSFAVLCDELQIDAARLRNLVEHRGGDHHGGDHHGENGARQYNSGWARLMVIPAAGRG